MNYNILKSRTFWVAILMAAYNALAQWPSNNQTGLYINGAVNILGMILITYFHINPSQNYGGATDTKVTP